MKLFKQLISLFVFVTIGGCAGLSRDSRAVYIDNLNLPLRNLHNIVSASLPVGLRSVSRNTRELLSQPFVVVSRGLEDPQFKMALDAVERFYAQVIILGDRRPYTLEIQVFRERRSGRGEHMTYENLGPDQRRTKALGQKIREELSKRREDLNIIDDFRAF